MTKITFVKPDWFYESYIDFWQLVELSEFPIIPLSELDISQEGVFIVSPMNGEWRTLSQERESLSRIRASPATA